MNPNEFLESESCLRINEIQPLAALLADAFSKYNDDCNVTGDDSGGNEKEGSSFLKGIQRIIKEKSFVNMNINTKKDLFEDPEKCTILRDTVDIKSLDVQFLLKLMKETSFLKLEKQGKEGKCQRHNGEKCCKYCDHDQEGKKCKQCDTTKSDCGKICCSSCNVCLKCHRRNLKDGKNEYLKGNIKMDDLKQSNQVCWMFPLKESLTTLLNCRNLVHVPSEKIEQLLKNGGGSIGEFQNIKNLDHLCKEIYFAATVLTLVLSKSNLFDRDVGKKAKEIEKRIDNMFYYDRTSQLRLSHPSMAKAYEHSINCIDFLKDRFKDDTVQMKLTDKDAGNIL